MDKVIARGSRAGGQLVESALHSGASGSPPEEERSIRLGMTTALIRVGEERPKNKGIPTRELECRSGRVEALIDSNKQTTDSH